MFPPSRTAVGFAPSSVAAASGSALRTKKLLLSDELLESPPPLLFAPEEDVDFPGEDKALAGFSEGTSASLLEETAPRGRGECLDVALIFALLGGAELKV